MPAALRSALALLAPPSCGVCAGRCEAARLLCEGCERDLRDARPALAAGPFGVEIAVSAAPYEGAARGLTHALKYGRRLGLASLGAELMAAACPPGDLGGVIVPVPAAPLRGRWRGFDPAAELALALARLTGLPASDCLRRRSGRRQVGRARAQRLADPPRVALRAPAPVSALLVDDVHTTGATLGACAAALRSGGSRRVVALCFARAR